MAARERPAIVAITLRVMGAAKRHNSRAMLAMCTVRARSPLFERPITRSVMATIAAPQPE
jgi:hypothetical protein